MSETLKPLRLGGKVNLESDLEFGLETENVEGEVTLTSTLKSKRRGYPDLNSGSFAHHVPSKLLRVYGANLDFIP